MRYFWVCFFLLLSCGKSPSEQDKGFSNFRITSVNSVSVKDTSSKYSFPRFSKVYQMSGTVLDIDSDTPIPHEKFVIDLDEEGRFIVESNAAGEIVWNESVSFNLLSEKSRILVKRNVTLSEDRSKSTGIEFSLYPFSSYLGENIDEFELIADKSEQFQTKLQASRAGSTKAQTDLIDPQVQVSYLGPQVRGGQFRFQLKTGVSAILKTKNGENFDFALKNSEFFVQVLVRSKSNQYYLNKFFDHVKLEDGKVLLDFTEVLALQKSFEDLYLGIRLTPKTLYGELESFHGIYKIGNVSELSGDHSLVFNRDTSSRYSSFKLPTDPGQPNQTKDPLTLNFDKLDIVFDEVGIGETPNKRQIYYRSSTCITDLYEDTPIAFAEFQIQKATGEIIERKSDSKGCIYWNEHLIFKYYMPENFFRRENVITHKASNISQRITSYINPWTILTIGRDEIEMDPDMIQRVQNREVIHSKLFLEQYSYETIGVTYFIDEFLELFVRKNIQLDLEFEVTRYSSIDQGFKAKEDIRDGVYLLKIGLEKSYIDTRKSQIDIEQAEESLVIKKGITRKPLEYIYIYNALVRVWNGHIITPVQLSIQDLRLMTVRTNFLIQLQVIEQDYLDLSLNFDPKELTNQRIDRQLEKYFPGQKKSLDLLVDHDSGLPTRTFLGPMILLEKEGGADVRPTDAINQCETDDCNYLEKDNPELQKRIFPVDKKYYDSIDHLIGQSVDNLLERKKILDLKYSNRKKVESLISNYLKNFNLMLVTNEPNEILDLPKGENSIECFSSDVDDCFIPTRERVVAPPSFVESLNSFTRDRKFETYSDLFDEKIRKEIGFNRAFCRHQTMALIRGRKIIATSPGDNRLRRAEGNIQNTIRSICDSEDTFTINEIIRARGVNYAHFLGGKTVNYDLGSAITIEFKEMSTSGASAEFNPLGFINLISKEVGDVINGIIAYTIHGSGEQEYSHGDSSEITSTTYLSMQRAAFEISFANPILCLEVRPTEDYVRKISSLAENYTRYFKFDKLPITQGYLICDIHQENAVKDIFFRENYYYFAQHFTEGHMLDDGSILNHPWLFGTRGDRDQVRFISDLGKKPNTNLRQTTINSEIFGFLTSPAIMDHEKLSKAYTENNLAELPLDQISQAYENILPSFPGIYVKEPHKKEFPYD